MSDGRERNQPPAGVDAPVGAVGGSVEPWPATAPAEPVIDAATHDRIERLASRYPTRRAALIPVLHIVQRRCGGWLPDYAIAAVAEEMGLTPSDVFGVVTFYDLFHQKPVGRHRIRVCTNLPCQLRGAEEILETLEETLGVPEGEVTADGRCSFVHFECLGSCDTAPMAMINDTYHENLTPEGVREIVEGLD